MAGPEDIDDVVKTADSCQDSLGRADRPRLLESIAEALALKRDAIIRTCSEETALTAEELAPEFERMTGTLRMFAGVVREGSWVRAAIDTRTDQAIGPGHDVRRSLLPLDGVVAVFGASNFPLAYGVCGGDTASALAAGCPVVVKEHPAHPRTGRLLAKVAREAIGAVDPKLWRDWLGNQRLPLGYIEVSGADNAVGAELAKCHNVAAIGFTGSREGGLALEAIGRGDHGSRQRPIPVFAEMGSANRVVICPHALAHRGNAIAAELAASILARHGQQCTKPGLICLPYPYDEQAGPAFARELARLLDGAAARRMLSPRVTGQYLERCRRLHDVPAIKRFTTRELEESVDGEVQTRPALFAAMDTLLNNLDSIHILSPEDRGFWLNDEIFGPAAIVLGSDGWENLWYADAALATTVYADPEDIEDLIERDDDETDEPTGLTGRVNFGVRTTGRFTFNTVPTGVRVCHAMVHGGPFPATNRPDTTAVGPMAIERWCRPVCFQNCPDVLLPPELQDANPLGIERLINGERTRSPVLRG